MLLSSSRKKLPSSWMSAYFVWDKLVVVVPFSSMLLPDVDDADDVR